MTGTSGWVTVIPGKGRVGEVARELLALADTPTHVRTDGNGSEFLVPPYLADRYLTPPPAPASTQADSTTERRPRRRLKKEDT